MDPNGNIYFSENMEDDDVRRLREVLDVDDPRVSAEIRERMESLARFAQEAVAEEKARAGETG